MRSTLVDVGEQLRREDVEALLLDRVLSSEQCFGVRQGRVVEVRIAGVTFALVDVVGEVLGDEPVEEHAEHIALEVPTIDASAQIIRYAPDCLVQFGALGFFGGGYHAFISCAGGANSSLVTVCSHRSGRH
ncbi:hypothetical protein SDC9_177529 [bioreactor metagenome]|uniref:Uncharacterized protein n=1 Tax=bioreactor metagenome TaxID=1076179 RepID=A0A645GVL9_9ZZZZ